jgi:hypothetical protein
MARNAARQRQRQQEQMLKQKTSTQGHLQAQQAMFSDDGSLSDEYIDALVQQGVDEQTGELMANVFSRDFVLSKISKAEKVEMKWLVRTMKLKIVAMHPRRESNLTGTRRAIYYDDADANLPRLTQRQRQLIDQAVWEIFFRVARSVDGWQQEEFSKQYNVSRMEDDNDDSGGRFGGLLS